MKEMAAVLLVDHERGVIHIEKTRKEDSESEVNKVIILERIFFFFFFFGTYFQSVFESEENTLDLNVL